MDLFGLTPLAGGHSGETFVADAAGERSVVRIYAQRGARRGPHAVEVDAAVLRLVRGLLPVPEVLEMRLADPAAGTPALLVTAMLPGHGSTRSWRSPTPIGARASDATSASCWHDWRRCRCCAPGLFVDAELRVSASMATDLVEWVARHREGTALAAWPQAEYDVLLDVAAAAQEVLDLTDRVCLVHSDFNAKNLLVDAETAAVTGLVDWEFAHAGGPFEDLGNLLRLERDAAFLDAVLETYADLVADAPGDLLDRARAADLFALVELAGRGGENPVADRAHDLLRAVVRTGDLHAWPF